MAAGLVIGYLELIPEFQKNPENLGASLTNDN